MEKIPLHETVRAAGTTILFSQEPIFLLVWMIYHSMKNTVESTVWIIYYSMHDAVDHLCESTSLTESQRPCQNCNRLRFSKIGPALQTHGKQITL